MDGRDPDRATWTYFVVVVDVVAVVVEMGGVSEGLVIEVVAVVEGIDVSVGGAAVIFVDGVVVDDVSVGGAAAVVVDGVAVDDVSADEAVVVAGVVTIVVVDDPGDALAPELLYALSRGLQAGRVAANARIARPGMRRCFMGSPFGIRGVCSCDRLSTPEFRGRSGYWR